MRPVTSENYMESSRHAGAPTYSILRCAAVALATSTLLTPVTWGQSNSSTPTATPSTYRAIELSAALGTWAIATNVGAGVKTPPQLCSRAGGETGTGTLLSRPFVLSVDRVRMRARGWDGAGGERNANAFQLIDADTGSVLRTAQPPLCTPVSKWIEWNTHDCVGRKVRLRLQDGDANNAYAWMGVDEIDAGPEFHVNFAHTPTLDDWELEGNAAKKARQPAMHHGIPYLPGSPALLSNGGSIKIDLGCSARRLFFFGLTNSNDIGTPLWWYPTDYHVRYWIGDKLGEVRLTYQDGSTEVYPLILGDNIFWGDRFHKYPEPFLSNANKRRVLEESLRLYPPTPVPGGFRMAFIEPSPKPIRTVEIVDRPQKGGVPEIAALTIEVAEGTSIGTALPPATPTPAMLSFLETQRMMPEGVNAEGSRRRLANLRNALYTTTDNFPASVPVDIPDGYDGPHVRFTGNVYAEVLTNVFHHNLFDMSGKVDDAGVYHTSTPDSADWGGYEGFGTWAAGHGKYSNQVWSRDMGRAIQELVALGMLDDGRRCVDYAFRQARLWGDPDNQKLMLDGRPIPPHWCRNLANPVVGKHQGVFENDGHGLTMLLVYNVWRRLPDNEQTPWLQERWADVELAADWIEWMFAHPELSRATEDVLGTDSEANYVNGAGLSYGSSLFADFPCMNGLLKFAEMAESVGQVEDARRWRRRAARMRQGIERHFLEGGTDGHPHAWRLEGSGWAYQSALLGPLIQLPDVAGFDPHAGNAHWRDINSASYQRLLDKWRGLGTPGDPWWFMPFEAGIYNRPEHYPPAPGNYSIAMGYGQAFFTQAALLLDRMAEAEEMIRWTARAIYDADHEPYIVPEGVETHPDGTAWFRTGDLGNGVQQAETMKMLRLIIGIDDMRRNELRLYPRMPRDWSAITVEDFPAWTLTAAGTHQRVAIDYSLRRMSGGMKLRLRASEPLGAVAVRLGPFNAPPADGETRLNGVPVESRTSRSGDSHWLDVSIPSGLAEIRLSAGGT